MVLDVRQDEHSRGDMAVGWQMLPVPRLWANGGGKARFIPERIGDRSKSGAKLSLKRETRFARVVA